MEHRQQFSPGQQTFDAPVYGGTAATPTAALLAWLARPSTKNGIFVLLLLFYAVLFVSMAHVSTRAMASISAIVLVIAVGWRFGGVAGLGAGLLSMPCNGALYGLLGPDRLRGLPAPDEAAVVTVAFMIIGGVIGHLHTLRSRHLCELAERRRAEQELARHLDRLDEQVRQRTTELERVNRQLIEEAEERKDALYELNSTKEYLENVIETSLDSIVIIDPTGKIVRVNRALLDLVGCSKDELIGRTIDRLSEIPQGRYETSAGETVEIGPDFINEARGVNAHLYADGKISNWEYYLVGRDGRLVPVEENIILLSDAQGRSIGAVGILRDITRRRQAENELKNHRDHLNDLVLEKTAELSAVNEKLAASNRLLRRSEQALNEAQHVAHIGNWEWNFVTGAAYWSDEMYRLLGYEPGQVEPGLDLYVSHIHADDRELIFSYPQNSDYGNPYLAREFRIITAGGETRFISSLVRTDTDAGGGTVRVYGTLQDITERKRVEQELEKRETVLKDAQRLAHVGSWERDFLLDTNFWSDEYYRILGYEPGEIEQTFDNFFNHIHPDDQDDFFTRHMTGNLVNLEFRIVQKSGDVRHVVALATIDMSPAGAPERVHGVLLDITERKIAENELLRYQNELEDLVHRRTAELEAAQEELLTREKMAVLGRLTATVSHELRNPLGVIRSSIFYLQKKIQNPEEKTEKHLRRIEQQISVCDGIVDELLEYTRGRQSEVAPGDIVALLAEVRAVVAGPAGVLLDWQAGGNLPTIGFDREKMRRVLINLVQNAMQAVAARQEKDPAADARIAVTAVADGGGVCIRVMDNGLGMTADTVSRAFEPLFTTRARGTGLGLAIVQKIVHEHGGTVELESRPDVGTTVSVRLPVFSHQPKEGHERPDTAG